MDRIFDGQTDNRLSEEGAKSAILSDSELYSDLFGLPLSKEMIAIDKVEIDSGKVSVTWGYIDEAHCLISKFSIAEYAKLTKHLLAFGK